MAKNALGFSAAGSWNELAKDIKEAPVDQYIFAETLKRNFHGHNICNYCL